MIAASVRRLWARLGALDPRLVDGLVVAVLTAAVLVEFLQSGRPWIRFPALLVTTVPLLWRRRYPIPSYLAQNAGLFLWLAPPLVTSLFAVFFGCYSMSLHARHRSVSFAIPLAQAALLAAIGIPFNFYTPAIPAWLAELVAGVGIWLAGDAVRGLRAVELRRQGTPRPLPPSLELAAYRVVQEALTNALKHAGGAATQVLVQFAEGQLDLEVRNERGAAGPEAEGAGRGLMGMRQRVAVHGGQLEAGPLPGGGFRVWARLPLTEPN